MILLGSHVFMSYICLVKLKENNIMGGFTKIQLKDVSEENIKKHNRILDNIGLRKGIRFYSEEDVKFEYEAFVKNDGIFPENQFPREQINSYEDFKKYWSTEALGEVFVPPMGALTFDCYFGRTSNRAMGMIGRYVSFHHDDIKKVSGSFETFMERGMTRLERNVLWESGLKNQIAWGRFKDEIKGY